MRPSAIVCTRISKMTVMHPDQAWELCFKCQHVVGVYPSGQRALAAYPKMKVICLDCAALTNPLAGIEVIPAGSIEEIRQEARDSVPVGKA